MNYVILDKSYEVICNNVLYICKQKSYDIIIFIDAFISMYVKLSIIAILKLP